MPSFSCHREITWIPEFNLAIKKHCRSSMWWKICPLHGHGLALSRYSKHNWKMNSLRDSKMNIILPCPPVAWVQFSSVTQLCPTLCTQSCLTLCYPMDCSLPVSSAHGIFQARILSGLPFPSLRGSSRPRDQTCISCIGRQILYLWATWEACQAHGRCLNVSYIITTTTSSSYVALGIFFFSLMWWFISPFCFSIKTE